MIDDKKYIDMLKNSVKEEEFSKYFDDFEIEYLKAQGLPLIKKNGEYSLTTSTKNIQDQEFVVVDIETNGSKPQNSQIIEIGAVKIKNGEVLDTFKSLVYASYVPDYVKELTGINEDMLKDAPKQKEVLKNFRKFLGNAVLVAHDSEFDYNYISAQMKKENLGKLYNRRVCSLRLSEKTLQASKYGLKTLVKELNLPEEEFHRAFGDAMSTYRIFQKSLQNLPENIKFVEDLVELTKTVRRKKKKKKDK